MKKKACILIPLLLLLAAAWYLWPRSLNSALSGLGQSEITHCYAILVPRIPGQGEKARTAETAPGSPEFDQLMGLLTSTRYVRSPFDLFRLGRASDAQTITLEPFSVDLYLRQANGRELTASFYGPVLLLNGRTYLPLGGSSFQQQAADLITGWPEQLSNYEFSVISCSNNTHRS